VKALANSGCRWDDVACPMRVGYDRCHKTDAHTPRLLRAILSQCRLPLADACRHWPLSPVVGGWEKALAGGAQSIRTHHGRCVKALADSAFRWPTSFTRCAHATSNACSPWMIPLIVCRCLLVDTRRPRPISPNRCAHAKIDACRPWPMSNVIGQCT